VISTKAHTVGREEGTRMTFTGSPDWTAIRSAVNQALVDNAVLLQEFREKVTIVFRWMLEGSEKPFKRRPPVSLRLICGGKPFAKLIVHPGWNSVSKTIGLDWVACELLQETSLVVNYTPVRKFGNQVDFIIRVGCPSKVKSIYRTAETDVGRVVDVIRDFLDDHRAVFARSHDHCSCCGRALTDELSRSRGIGPECIKKIDAFGVKELPWNQLVVSEDEPVTTRVSRSATGSN
jgi:hypothetical protein